MKRDAYEFLSRVFKHLLSHSQLAYDHEATTIVMKLKHHAMYGTNRGRGGKVAPKDRAEAKKCLSEAMALIQEQLDRSEAKRRREALAA